MRHRQWIKHWFNYIVWYMMTSSTGVYTNVVLEMLYRHMGRHSLQPEELIVSKTETRWRVFSSCSLNMHWMLESGLLSEYSKLAGQNICCRVTFNYRRRFPAWQVYVPMYNQWQEDAKTGGVEGSYSCLQHLHQISSVLDIPRAPAWALRHCCLLLQKEESGTVSTTC